MRRATGTAGGLQFGAGCPVSLEQRPAGRGPRAPSRGGAFFEAVRRGRSQLSQGPRWRPHQRRARRCRLQLQPAPSLVRGAFTRTVADPPPRPLGAPPHLTRRFETFFTADILVAFEVATFSHSQGHPEHMVSGLDKGCAGFDNGAPPRNGIGLSRPAAKKEPETPKSFAEREP